MSAPKLLHPELGSAPQCEVCGDWLDEDRWKVGTCLDCQSELDRKERKDYESEYGIVEWEDMRAGRGMPKG